MPLALQKLNLTHFRSYDALRLDLAAARIAVLTGPNGAGKTNILEAVSLLIPRRPAGNEKPQREAGRPLGCFGRN